MKRGWQCWQRDSVLRGRQQVLRDLIDLVKGVINREDQLLVVNKQTEGGPKCWKCNRWGHFQKDCKQGNSSGTVAVISAVGDQSTNQLGLQDTKVKVYSDQTLGSNKQKSEVMGSIVKKKGPRYPKRQTRQGTKGKQMVGKAESPSNPPLWVKLDFKTVQIPSLVDTGAQFSCIRKDVVVTY